MAITVSPAYKTGEYTRSRTLSRLIEVYNVESNAGELHVPTGQIVAAHTAGVPLDTGLTTAGGRILRVVSKLSKRIGPQYCKVEVTYEWKADEDRRHYWLRVFDERFEVSGEGEHHLYDLDWVPVGQGEEGYTKQVPRGIYTFKVLCYPLPVFAQTVGLFNNADYPPVWPSASRPVRFGEGKLLYLGFTGGRARDLDEVEGHTYPWELGFKFAYDPKAEWEYYPWVLMHSGKTELDNLWGYWYFDPVEQISKPLEKLVGEWKVPIMLPGGQGTGRIARIREGYDFTNFGFDWSG